MLHGNVSKTGRSFLMYRSDFADGLMCCTVFENIFKLADSKYWVLRIFKASVKRCESFIMGLYDYTEVECTIQEIYFSECRVGTTIRMLLDQNNRQKNLKRQILREHRTRADTVFNSGSVPKVEKGLIFELRSHKHMNIEIVLTSAATFSFFLNMTWNTCRLKNHQ